ncbi:MAG: response regulator transcription factor [bacterium]
MKKILIVEDEFDVSKVLKKRLSDAKYEVVIAGDTYQGNQMARKEHPDLIVLDLMMPGGGGLEVIKNIRLSTSTKFIPVVVLTGMSDEEYKKKVMDAGVEAYLEKPYDPENLISTIRNILGE